MDMEIINKLHFYSFYPIKKVDEKDFRALELIINRPLPLSYKEFYIANNGGRIKENFFYRNPNDEFETFIVNDFYHIDSNEENDKYGNNIFTIIKNRNWKNWKKCKILPWGHDGSNNLLYLDFNEAEPRVYADFYDGGEEGILLADSIDEFLQKLREDPDGQII